MEALMEDVVFTASSSGYLSKASDSALEETDVIGIYALDPIDALNVKGYVAPGGKVEPQVPVKWGLKQSRPTRFSAYMPFAGGLTGVDYRFYVQQDQKTYESYAASDLRYAVADTRPGDVVDFRMQHTLSKLVVVMEDGSEISGVSTSADIELGVGLNLVDGSLSRDTKKGIVNFGKATKDNGDEGFVAIIVPQEGLFPLDVTLPSGEKLQRTLKEPVKFDSGMAYKAVISYDHINFRISVTPWANGGDMEFGRPKLQ